MCECECGVASRHTFSLVRFEPTKTGVGSPGAKMERKVGVKRQEPSVKTTLNSTRERQHTRSRQGYRYARVRCTSRWKMVIMREGERRALPLFSFTLIPVLLLVINNSNLFNRILVQQ